MASTVDTIENVATVNITVTGSVMGSAPYELATAFKDIDGRSEVIGDQAHVTWDIAGTAASALRELADRIEAEAS